MGGIQSITCDESGNIINVRFDSVVDLTYHESIIIRHGDDHGVDSQVKIASPIKKDSISIQFSSYHICTSADQVARHLFHGKQYGSRPRYVQQMNHYIAKSTFCSPNQHGSIRVHNA